MKKFQSFKILFLLLLMVSFATQTAKATSVNEVAVYLNGGNDGLLRDLYCNLSNASLSQTDSIKGRCFLSFAISKEGVIEAETIKLLRDTSLPDEYVNAAIEAIKHLGTFKPGRQYNAKEERWVPLRTHYTINVSFPIPSKYLELCYSEPFTKEIE